MSDVHYLPALWGRVLIDTLAEWIGEENIEPIVTDAVSVWPAFNPDDPLRRILLLDDFAELQRAIRRKLSAPRSQQILMVSGRRVLHTLTEGRGVRMPHILRVMKGHLADHITNTITTYNDYLNAISDQQVSLHEQAQNWLWRIQPYPLFESDIRGWFEIGMVQEMTTLATTNAPLNVTVSRQIGHTLELIIERPGTE